MATTALVRTGEPGGALATIRPPVGLLRPIAAPQEVIGAQEATRELVAKALKPGRDFGAVPGTDKPTLLKPGAERVALAFGCYYGEPRITEREVDHDREVKWVKRRKVWRNQFKGDREFTWAEETGVSLGLYRYVVEVPVIHRETGLVVGAGIGACSTMESKYIDRPRDSENTVLKMAHKRALVGAALITFGLSDQFTQDVEDLPHLAETAPAAGDDAPAASGARSVGGTAAAGVAEPAAKCPKCSGAMWDNRATKTNPKSPDFKCKDRSCDGVYWPGQWPPKADAAFATGEQRDALVKLAQHPAVAQRTKDAIAAALADAEKPLTAERAEKWLLQLGERIAAAGAQAEAEAGDEPAAPAQGATPAPAEADLELATLLPDPLPTTAPKLLQVLTTLLDHRLVSDETRTALTKRAAEQRLKTPAELREAIEEVAEEIRVSF